MLLQKYRDRNGRYIGILFKNVVKGSVVDLTLLNLDWVLCLEDPGTLGISGCGGRRAHSCRHSHRASQTEPGLPRALRSYNQLTWLLSPTSQ